MDRTFPTFPSGGRGHETFSHGRQGSFRRGTGNCRRIIPWPNRAGRQVSDGLLSLRGRGKSTVRSQKSWGEEKRFVAIEKPRGERENAEGPVRAVCESSLGFFSFACGLTGDG